MDYGLWLQHDHDHAHIGATQALLHRTTELLVHDTMWLCYSCCMPVCLGCTTIDARSMADGAALSCHDQAINVAATPATTATKLEKRADADDSVMASLASLAWKQTERMLSNKCGGDWYGFSTQRNPTSKRT